MESKFTSETSYHSVNPTPEQQSSEDIGTRPKIELGQHPQIERKRGWVGTVFWQVLGVLWLVPIIALLYLNFTEFIIGASAWCPDGHCWLNAFNPNTEVPQQRARDFDKADHNLLGGLQFVAKGLEVWFTIVAASLMYILTMIAAGKKEGLPVGYLTRPLEFSDVVSVFDTLLWVTGPSPFGAKAPSEKRVGRRVWSLIVLSIYLMILINLMGPATAVLAIPSLSWIDTKEFGNRMFQNMNGPNPPKANFEGWFWWYNAVNGYCTQQDFAAQNYSCTQNEFGYSLDAWIDSAMAGRSIATQGGLTFELNYTAQSSSRNSLQLEAKAQEDKAFSDYTFWAPSRQIISNLSVDYTILEDISIGYEAASIDPYLRHQGYFPDPIESYVEYNKSLQLTIQRNGPVVGTIVTMWADYGGNYSNTIEVDANRWIRCYAYYELSNVPFVENSSKGNYTKCIRIGSGWSESNKHANFYTTKVYNEVTGKDDPGVNIDIYSSDKAVFLKNGKLPDFLPAACLTDGPVLNRTHCDWNRLFHTDPSSDVFNRTQNVNTIEMVMYNDSSATALVVDFVAFYNFTTYSLDPFPSSNPTLFVQNGDLPMTGTNFAVDPSWVLAGYSIGLGGTLQQNRTSANLLQSVLSYQMNAGPDATTLPNTADYLSLLPVLQTLSIIDHSTVPTQLKKSPNPVDFPILRRNARMYVWAYGLGSRTSYLGVAVAIAGCMIVVWQFLLGFTDRRRYRSPTQLLVAALEHSPRGEFEGRQHNEVEMARVRFHVKPNDHLAGKYSFHEPDTSHDSNIVL